MNWMKSMFSKQSENKCMVYKRCGKCGFIESFEQSPTGSITSKCSKCGNDRANDLLIGLTAPDWYKAKS